MMYVTVQHQGTLATRKIPERHVCLTEEGIDAQRTKEQTIEPSLSSLIEFETLTCSVDGVQDARPQIRPGTKATDSVFSDPHQQHTDWFDIETDPARCRGQSP